APGLVRPAPEAGETAPDTWTCQRWWTGDRCHSSRHRSRRRGEFVEEERAMLRMLVDARGLVATIVAAVIGAWGLYTYPMNHDDVFLALVALQNPSVFKVFSYGYATFWFTTPFLAASLVLSLVALVVYRRVPSARHRALPAYPPPETRPAPTLVLGERHFATKPGPAPTPRWLTIPQRGLYTGVMVLG